MGDVFRFIVGIGLGGVPVAYGLFMEFLPSENRGVHLTLIELFWTLGSMIESALAWIILPRHSWRMLLLVSTVPLFFSSRASSSRRRARCTW